MSLSKCHIRKGINGVKYFFQKYWYLTKIHYVPLKLSWHVLFSTQIDLRPLLWKSNYVDIKFRPFIWTFSRDFFLICYEAITKNNFYCWAWYFMNAVIIISRWGHNWGPIVHRNSGQIFKNLSKKYLMEMLKFK